MAKVLKLLATIGVAAVFVAGAAVALSPAASRLTEAGRSEEEELFLGRLDQRSLVFDRNGTLLATLYGEQNRAPVRLAEIPMEVRNAVLAVEDRDFYSHDGVNLRATVRALFENVSSGSIQQGGSTITMQVVKNSLLGSEQTLDRKSQEAVLAMRLEQELTKDQILERYLNTAYFGNGAYGVQAAAETYWGVGVGELDWGQAALLAALIRNPNYYNPIRFPEIAAERRRLALDRLVDIGHITEEEAEVYAFQPLPRQVHRVTPPPDDYFVEEVKRLLLHDPRFGIGDTYEERYNAVFSGGLRVHTTLDLRMQLLAVKARDEVLPGDLPGQFLFRARQGGEVVDVQGTAVVVTTDTRTGAVRALVGGPGFDEYRYNIATQGIGRQPGSTFKVFVLAAALESGLVPNDTIAGHAPCRIPNPGGTPDPYVVRNYGESRGGSGTITSQTARSSNCAFARLGQVVGLERVAEVARRMGITTQLEAVPSMPIGSKEVLPIEMAAAYASLGNDGVYNAPYYIDRIEDPDGNVLYQHVPDPRRAVSRQTARLATEVLETNVRSGTGTRARIDSQPAAGKTGTTQQSHDGWFVGYTPQLSTAVWMGATVGQVPMRNVGGITVTGGSYPARIWGAYMGEVLAGSVREEFPDPGPTRSGRSLRPDFESGSSSGSESSGSSRSSRSRSGSPSSSSGSSSSEEAPDTTAPATTAPATTAPSPPAQPSPADPIPDTGD